MDVRGAVRRVWAEGLLAVVVLAVAAAAALGTAAAVVVATVDDPVPVRVSTGHEDH